MVKGFFFDGNSSSKNKATLSVDVTGRYQLDSDKALNGQFSDLEISSRIGNTARYITFPDGSLFETQDNDAVDDIVKNFSDRKTTGLAHKLESKKSIVLSTMVAVVLFSWVFVQFGIPHFSNQIAMMLPENVPRLLGQGVLETMDKRLLSKTELDKTKQQQLQHLFNDIKTDIGNLDFMRLELRNGGRLGANAFALPDGTIVFTDKIIELADSDQEIQAIMYHEIGHIEHRHAIRSVIQQFSLAIFIMVVTGDVSTSSSIITALPAFLIEAGFSQEMEWEADTFALNNMLQNDVDPVHFANMMAKLAASHEKKLGNKCNDTGKDMDCEKETKPDIHSDSQKEKSLLDYLSTHPPTSERIDRFKNHSNSIREN